jgi:hypothetical protein
MEIALDFPPESIDKGIKEDLENRLMLYREIKPYRAKE